MPAAAPGEAAGDAKETLVQARMQNPAKIIPDAMKAIQAALR
jgi:hypothetical protein